MQHPPTRRILLALPLLALPLLAQACNTTRPQVDEVPRELRGRWFLVELEGVDLADPELAKLRQPELMIDDEGAVSGFGGVNRFGSTLDLDVLGVRHFSLSRITSTMKAGPPEAMDLEQHFLQALQDARVYRLDEGRLELRDFAEDDEEQGALLIALSRTR